MSSWSEAYELVKPLEREWEARTGMQGNIETSTRAFEGVLKGTFSSETDDGHPVFGVVMDIGMDRMLPIEVWIPFQKIVSWFPW